MAAPKGNKFALGNKGGRPPRDKDKLFTDLVEWAKRPDSIHLAKFASTYEPPFPTRALYKWKKESEDYEEAYLIAKDFLAWRREEWVNNDMLKDLPFKLNFYSYDYIAYENHKEKVAFESQVKAQEANQLNDSDRLFFNNAMKQIKEAQNVCNMEENSNNIE